MNPETIHGTTEILTATAAAATAIYPYARHLSQATTKIIQAAKALHNKTTKPRARHRQGKGRHTK